MKRIGVLAATMVVAGLVSATSALAASTVPLAGVWVEPTAGYGFVSHAMQAAHHSIDLSMYELEDATIEQTLRAAAARGLRVRVIVNADYTGAQNNAAVAALRGSAVHVVWAPAAQIFHAKYFVIDGTSAYVGTGNFTPQYYASSRDVWTSISNPQAVAALEGTFAHDFAGATNQLVAGPGIVWSPGSLTTLTAVIGSARHSLWVENEEMKVGAVEQALAAAASRGVDVHVTMTASASWAAALQYLANAGVHVVTHSGSQLYIHAKLICVDCGPSGGTLFLGSENFSTSSLSYNREVGVITTTPSVVATVWRAEVSDGGVGVTVVKAGSQSSGSGTLRVLAFPTSVARGSYPTVSVQTTANASCSLQVTLPSGRISGASGLGSSVASASGVATWTWHISTSTTPGVAEVVASCPNGTVRRSVAIT